MDKYRIISKKHNEAECMKREKEMYQKYAMLAGLVLLLGGCTGKDKIPPMPPKSETTSVEEVRTIAEMESKLERIRNPIHGENLSVQKDETKEEIDTLLGDAKAYKHKVSRFEKAQLRALKKAQKSYKYKLKKQGKKPTKKPVEKKESIDMVNEYENKLKYY